MKPKSIMTALLLAFVAVAAMVLVYKETTGRGDKKTNSNPAKAAPQRAESPKDELIVYFFHGRNRCKSCKIIEANAKQTLEKDFSKELSSGRIVWRDIDLDAPENQHFIQDYQIISISLVLADMQGGKQKQWKNLEQVWDLLQDKDGFRDYVHKEVRAWL